MARDPEIVLKELFGYDGFRPGQEELVRAALAGRDALGVLPTGGGKSVCYQVPAAALEGLTLIVTPLISLMEDQVGRAREAGLRAEHLSATRSTSERDAALRGAIRGELDLLFVSPERLDSPAFVEIAGRLRVVLVAVDEAHCISEWGHDFRPAYRRIGLRRGLFRAPLLALTATATPSVREDVVRSLALENPAVVVRSFDRPNLAWSVLSGRSHRERMSMTYRLLREGRGPSIVYAPTRRVVEQVRDRLAATGIRSVAYHAGMEGDERSEVQSAFMSDACRVVVATNAFGMGIDKPDVRLVVHIQLPGTLEAYYQEAGRAGRDGDPSDCIAFHHRSDQRLGRRFVDRAHPGRRDLTRSLRVLTRHADATRVANLSSPGLRKVFGAEIDAWRSGDPVGTLGSLERLRVLRRLRGGTAEGPSGSDLLVGVGRSPDLARAERLRRANLAKLKAVRRYATEKTCRTRALLRYFGEEASPRCGRCDRCRQTRRVRTRIS